MPSSPSSSSSTHALGVAARALPLHSEVAKPVTRNRFLVVSWYKVYCETETGVKLCEKVGRCRLAQRMRAVVAGRSEGSSLRDLSTIATDYDEFFNSASIINRATSRPPEMEYGEKGSPRTWYGYPSLSSEFPIGAEKKKASAAGNALSPPLCLY